MTVQYVVVFVKCFQGQVPIFNIEIEILALKLFLHFIVDFVSKWRFDVYYSSYFSIRFLTHLCALPCFLFPEV